MHGLADRDIGGRSAGYGSPEVGGPVATDTLHAPRLRRGRHPRYDS